MNGMAWHGMAADTGRASTNCPWPVSEVRPHSPERPGPHGPHSQSANPPIRQSANPPIRSPEF
ncbi:hypothetical protein NA56DRAFT_471895 [Hyaloscypha hepaticicola]|uniref:Uncharacterized protein n=1 Tax=Hyaloscypha hepaticicola TaxID=2082293 RepID=A0A2J6QFT4_9HELO|nr:hypothetical protein NA56DRAFT_471895 [Hyaloscypha hepaticicola]